MRHRLQQLFYPSTPAAIAEHRPVEAPQRKPQPQTCPSLAYDRLEWTAREFRLAAAVLGAEAASLLSLVTRCSHHAALTNDEAVRIADGLARTAWHYATQALQAEEVAYGTFGGARR